MSADPGSECPSVCPLIVGCSQGRSLGTGEVGFGFLKTETEIESKRLSGKDTVVPRLPLTPVASPSSTGGGMNSPSLIEEGLSGFLKAGASGTRSGWGFLGGGRGTTSSSGMAFEPPSATSSTTEYHTKKKTQGYY